MTKSFVIDARTILTLGRESIKDKTTALLELVKNCYDADSTVVEVEIYSRSNANYIRVADNGVGMTEKEVDDNWLRIGYSEKRSKKFSKLKRRKTGEKGIGRISADRLGSILTLKTKSSDNDVFGLEINWDDFDTEGKRLSAVPIKILDKPKIDIPKIKKIKRTDSGTELLIKNLRQKWTKSDVENLRDELSILTPPFKKVKDFEIFIKTDISDELSSKIESPFYESAEIELNAIFDGKIIIYKIIDRYTDLKLREKKVSIEWDKLVQKNFIPDHIDTNNIPKFGPIEIKLLFFPRESKLLEGTKFSLSDLREFLNENAGIKIYRDNIRVKPYGNPKDPEGDWLGLAERKTREPAGIGRRTWKVAANQIVGAVFLGRDKNPNLVDSSSREGLIQGEAFYELSSFLLGCITLLESHRHQRFIREREIKPEEKVSPSEEISLLKKDLGLLKKDLNIIKRTVPKSTQRPIQRTIDHVLTVSDKIDETTKSLDKLIDQTQVFRGLATIGIASAVFGHETQSSIAEFISATYTASSILRKKPEKVDIALDEINKAIKYADRVSAWGTFALVRVQRDKRRRRKLSIKKVIESVLNEFKAVFEAVDIKIHSKLANVEAKTFAMDIEAILINLLTNSYIACLQQSEKRNISLRLTKQKKANRDGFSIIVSDTGPGIDDKFKDSVWEPLFTTRVDKKGKQVGTGLGLTIIKSIVDDLNGTKGFDFDPELKGARFEIWLPLT